MSDNQGNDTAARRLNAIRSYRFKPSEGMLTEETVFLLGQIDARDTVIERLCLAIGGLRMRIEDQGKEIEWLRVRNATLEAAAEAAIEWREARRSVLVSCAKSEMLTSAQVVSLNNMEKGIERALAALYAAPKSTASADREQPEPAAREGEE